LRLFVRPFVREDWMRNGSFGCLNYLMFFGW
jgi:hypothetical protein